MSRAFDAIIVGAGQAGPPLAGRLTDAGMTVALIERHLVGGTCVNAGCTPTKTMIASAHAAHMARRAADFGVTVGGPVSVDMAAVKARKDKVSGASRSGLEGWIAGMDGCTLIRGHARFQSPREIAVGGEVLTAERIFLNVGGRAVVPDMPGLADVPFLTSTSILDLDRLPDHLVVIGGSYVALEFAQMFRRFGSAVTVIERGPRLISREDTEISAAVTGVLEAEGIRVVTGADQVAFAPAGAGIAVTAGSTAGEGPGETFDASHVLVAVGRRPNTDDLGLDAAGVAMDKRGYVTVDDGLQTSVPGIWALGDCNGRGAFTHTSYNDFEIVAANLLDGEVRKVGDRIPAYALYTDPPLGRVGLTEAEAVKAGHKVLVGARPMTRVSRAVEKGESQGLMKVVVDADSRRIIGAAILGVGGDEAIHGVLDMMWADTPFTTLQQAVPIHPTVSELIPTILGEMVAR